MPGLRGFLPAAIERAANRYAAGIGRSGARQRQLARQVFAAAAAAYVYGLPLLSVRSTVQSFPRNQIVSIAALTTPAVQTVVSPTTTRRTRSRGSI